MAEPLVSRRNVRRVVSIPGVALCAATLAATAGMWVPVATAVDLATAGRRLHRLRALTFALWWTSLETAGVALACGLWALGRSGDRDANYALQRWWAARLVDGMRIIGNVAIEVEGLDLLTPGPVVVCARHASIADSLLPAWLLGRQGMHPRYVLKRELLVDPCLDVVGNRLPNHFVTRGGGDTVAELDALRELATGMGARDAAVIFPEGTLANDVRRADTIRGIAMRDPERGTRLRRLRMLLPPRAAGAAALLEGAPHADVVLMAHTGFDGLDRVASIPERIPFRAPVRVVLRRVPRSEVPGAPAFARWLDDAWCELDAWTFAVPGHERGAVSASTVGRSTRGRRTDVGAPRRLKRPTWR